MTALALVAARADDDSPVATWADEEGAPLYYMTRDRVDALVQATRNLIESAGANLVELRRGNAHLVAGFDSWHEAVQAWFSDLGVWKLAPSAAARVEERQALVASLTLAGHTVREMRDLLGASAGIVNRDQRTLGLVPDRPLPDLEPQPAPVDPFRGLSARWEVLARVAAQDDRGLTSIELDAELDRPLGTATGSLSKLAARGLVEQFGEPRRNRRPYRVTDAGRVRLAQVLAERDAAAQVASE